ncbi:hypothetical protein FHS27_006435, partial [Rhodopirellula rubra]|nr:hypothetical protein [Aporhodopirellula rubra]
QLLLKGCFQQSVTRPFHHQYKTAALAAYLNHGVHTERGLQPVLKWTTLLSPPGDAGRYSTES